MSKAAGTLRRPQELQARSAVPSADAERERDNDRSSVDIAIGCGTQSVPATFAVAKISPRWMDCDDVHAAPNWLESEIDGFFSQVGSCERKAVDSLLRQGVGR